MGFTRKLIYVSCLIMLGNCLASVSYAQSISKKEKLLRYQEVFYHLYRKDAFNALVNFRAGAKNNALPVKLKRNHLLMGSLYHMYDLDDMAELEFLNVIKKRGDAQQKAMAWYYLAKIYYESDNFRLLSKALQNSHKSLPKNLQNERFYLLGMYYIKLRDYQKATDALRDIEEETFWYQMLKFNLGASFIKANMGEKGIDLIRSVGESDQSSENMLALKDKSNIVLGYYFLRNTNSNSAINVLENVRLAGPFSDKALLGLGWAYTEKQQFRKALIPWLALTEKDPAEVTVQEAQLAVPYAFTQLKAEDKSLELYQQSIESYESVKAEIDLALARVKKTSIFNILLGKNSFDDYTISRKIVEQKDSLEGRVLVDLLETEEMQQMFRTYRDLKQLQTKLGTWQDDLEKMKLVLRTMPESGPVDPNKPRSRPFTKNKRYYVEKVLTLTDRVKLQNDRINILMGMYESFVRDHIVKALNKKRQYIVTYLSQTRFALAELLDKAQSEMQ